MGIRARQVLLYNRCVMNSTIAIAFTISVNVNEPLRSLKSQHKDGGKKLKVHLHK